MGNNDAVAGQRLSIVPASADHSAAATARIGDKDYNNDKANELSLRVVTGAGDNDPITAWHQIDGSQRHLMPTLTVGTT